MKHLIILFFCSACLQVTAQKSTILFNGKSTDGWHTWHSDKVVGWKIEDGALTTDGDAGDLVTDKEYHNFVLTFEYKISPEGNSGVVYKVIEDPKDEKLFATYASGPEFQIIDDENYPGEVLPEQHSGANYALAAPLETNAANPAGSWNKGKIICKDNHVMHFINNKLVANYTYGSTEWSEMVKKTKFATWPYATPHNKGKIALQGHGDQVWFKNIKIKEL